MKKLLLALLALLLTLAMVLSLTACGEDSKKKSKKGDDDEDDEKTSENGGTNDEDEDDGDDDKDDEKQPAASAGNSIEATCKAYAEGMATGDAAKILNVMPDSIVQSYMEMYEASSFSELVDLIEEDFDYDTDYRDLDSVTVEQVSFDDYGVSREEMMESLEEYYDIAPSEYSDIVVVEITMEYDGEEDWEYAVLIKIGSGWYIVN